MRKLEEQRKVFAKSTKGESASAQREKILKAILALGGVKPKGKVNKKLLPLGMQLKRDNRNRGHVSFRNLAQKEDYVLITFKPGFLFVFNTFKSGGKNHLTKKRVLMAKSMKKGQLLITLTWKRNPSDLDLYVIAPPKPGHKKDDTIGGNASPKGKSINWMNKGDAHAYPYTVLDVDDMDGDGPETVSVHKPVSGTFKIWVECYSCWGQEQNKKFKKNGAHVNLYDRYGLSHHADISHAKGKPSKWWEVATRRCEPKHMKKHPVTGVVDWADKCTVTPINKFLTKKPE